MRTGPARAGPGFYESPWPVYLTAIREQASIDYLRKYVQGVLHWLGTHPAFFNDEDGRNARNDAERALQVYETL